MAKQQAMKSQAPVARSSGPKNRQRREEEQPDPTPQELAAQQRETNIRNAAKTGRPYGEVAAQFGISLSELQAIIAPDLTQKVDFTTMELEEPEFLDDESEEE